MTFNWLIELFGNQLTVSALIHARIYAWRWNTMQSILLKRHFTSRSSSLRHLLLRLKHLPSLSCQTCIIIHITNTFPSLFITLFLYQQKKKFSASGKQKTILRHCGNFTEMCLPPFSLSNSICCHLHKNACMVSQLLHKGAIEYIVCGWRTVWSVCVFVLCSTYSICLLTCEWTNGRDLLMQIYLSHRERLRKLACMVHVCHTCIVNM